MRINVKQSVCSKDEFVVFRKRRIARKVKRLVETVREYDSHIYCLCEDGYEGTAYMASQGYRPASAPAGDAPHHTETLRISGGYHPTYRQ